MARITAGDTAKYIEMLQKLDYSADDVFKKMVQAGCKIVLPEWRQVLPTFRKYIKVKPPKKNEWGWFGQIQIRGHTHTGYVAAAALMAYEYGRKIRGTTKKTEGRHSFDAINNRSRIKVEKEMQRIYEEELKKLTK